VPRFQWTVQKVRELEDRYPVEGATPLSREFGVSVQTIINNAGKRGLRNPKGSERFVTGMRDSMIQILGLNTFPLKRYKSAGEKVYIA